MPGSFLDGTTDRMVLAGSRESGRGMAGAARVRKGQARAGDQSEEPAASLLRRPGCLRQHQARSLDKGPECALLWEIRHGWWKVEGKNSSGLLSENFSFRTTGLFRAG